MQPDLVRLVGAAGAEGVDVEQLEVVEPEEATGDGAGVGTGVRLTESGV